MEEKNEGYEYEVLACVVPGHLVSISEELSRIEAVKSNPLAMWVRIGYIRTTKEFGDEEIEKIVKILIGKQKLLGQKVHGVIKTFQIRQLKVATKESGEEEMEKCDDRLY